MAIDLDKNSPMTASANDRTTQTFVYVARAADGVIATFAMDRATGALTARGQVDAGAMVMPMAVSPDRRHLYASVRSEPYRIATFAIDAGTGALTACGTAVLPSSMPYVSTDATGRFLFTASYGDSLVAVSAIGRDGVVAAPAHQVLKTGRFAHAILPDRTNRFVFATNLGSDQIAQFRFDAATGMLTENDPPACALPPGHGPRHFQFSPDNRFVYVLHELSGHVAQLALNPDRGTLTLIETVASVPAGSGLAPGLANAPIGPAGPVAAVIPAAPPKIWCADIQLTPNGRFAYTTERTQSMISLFEVAPVTTCHPDRCTRHIPDRLRRKVR
jgi:6-phosphogluconolactonase